MPLEASLVSDMMGLRRMSSWTTAEHAGAEPREDQKSLFPRHSGFLTVAIISVRPEVMLLVFMWFHGAEFIIAYAARAII
jgi:hypothetical protein